MTTSRPPAFRRAIGPLGAMAVIGLTAGFLVGQDAARAGASDDVPPPTAVPAPTPTPTPSTRSTAAGGGRRAATGLRTKGIAALPVPTSYRFLLSQPGSQTPIRWDPCRAVHYKVAVGESVPTTEIASVRAAFDAVGQALGGVSFVYDGPTDVVPDTVDDSARAGTDIVFAFAVSGSGDAGSDLLAGWEAGRGGFAAADVPVTDGVAPRVRQRPTHGSVVIDASKWSVMSRHDRAVLYLHEIGHSVGLDHPKDARQIMSSGAYDLPPRYQPGDLAGLAKLGRKAGCA